jgi:hypothetical protein
MSYDCTQRGHVWLEANGQPYTRHRGQGNETVDVSCAHCLQSAAVARYSGYSGNRKPGQPIDKTVPPQFQRVMDRALTETPPGPADMR